MTRRLEGHPLAERLRRGGARSLEVFATGGRRRPQLIAVRFGEDPTAWTTADALEREARSWGAAFERVSLSPRPLRKALSALKALGRDEAVAGIVLLRPLPSEIDPLAPRMALPQAKDVGVDHPLTESDVLALRSPFVQPLAASVEALILDARPEVAGAHVVLWGWGGVPAWALAVSLGRRGAVVTLAPAHADAAAREADVVVCQRGGAPRVGRADVRRGSVLIDLGVRAGPDGRLEGDADAAALEGWVEALAPVPGGLGPLPPAYVLKNLSVALHRPHASGGPLPLFSEGPSLLGPRTENT